MNFTGIFTKTALAAGVMIAMSGCGGREKVAIAAKDDTIRRQEELLAKERANQEELHKANAALAAQNDQLAVQNAEATKANTLAQQQNSAEVARMRAQLDEMNALVKGIGSHAARPGQVGLDENQPSVVTRDANGNLKIIVASSVLFESGKADLKTSAHPTLKNICSVIKSRYPANYLRIEGHTDSTPVVRNKDKFKDNMELSIVRSRAVYDFMMHDGGIAANKMYTAGYGEFQPIIHPEKTAADRAKNRRVEIVILPTNVKIEKEKLAEASSPAKKK